jgi:sialidase-1
MPESAQHLVPFFVQPVFVNRTEGYACYRIPSIVRMGNDDLLAVCEGRLANCGDHDGVIRVVAKISQDNGLTWGPLFEIARNVVADGSEHVAQNPSPVVDMLDPAHPQGKIVIIYNKTEYGERKITEGLGVRRVYTIESVDHGRTWINETDITAQVHKALNPAYTAVYTDAAERYASPEDWRLNFPATGHAIQLRGGLDNKAATRGRLFVAAKVTIGDAPVTGGQNCVYWSDDHGASWQIGGVASVRGFDEAMAVELEDGSVMVNFRNNTGPGGAQVKLRGVMVHHFDADGHLLMSADHRDDAGLPDPAVQGSIHRYSWSDDADLGSRSRILFSNPNSTVERENMTVRLSYDEGQTWPVSRVIDDSAGAYSDLTVTGDKRVGLLYERGNAGGIFFAGCTLAWLTNGQDSIT